MNYDDIINTRYPFDLKHPRMSVYNRSAQFAPFAALTGHSESIKETARLTDEQIEINEDQKEIINQKLIYINKYIKVHPNISITYFVKDKKKKGGKYITITSEIKKIDTYNKVIILVNNNKILFDDIISIHTI